MSDLETDVVVAGSGAGGLVASLILAERGLNVILFESGDKLGGGAALSNGEVWVPGNHLELKSGINDSVSKGEAYLESISSGSYVDRRLRKTWLVIATFAVRYLEERGIRWRMIENLSDTFYPQANCSLQKGRLLEVEPFVKSSLGDWAEKILLSPHVPYQLTNDEMISKGGAGRMHTLRELLENRSRRGILCQGPGLVAYLLKAAVSLGVNIFTMHRVIIVEKRKGFNSVTVRWKGGTKKVYARKGVLLNLGGYDWHPKFAKMYEDVPEYHSPMPPSICGDSILISAQIGAAFVPHRIINPRLGYHIPGEYFLGRKLYRQVTFETGYPHSIVVNKKGERFADESQFHILAKEAAAYINGKGYVNFPCFAIFDEEFRRNYSFGPIVPETKVPSGFAVVRQSIEELESSLRFPEGSLVNTVKEFNEGARLGLDLKFGRGSNKWANQFAGDITHQPNPNLGEVKKAPFYAVRLTFVGVGRNAGLLVDIRSNVLDASLKPIPGLHACGNCVASTEMGHTYQDGSALSRSIAFGFLSAISILGLQINDLALK